MKRLRSPRRGDHATYSIQAAYRGLAGSFGSTMSTMKHTSIRLSDSLYEIVRREAEQAGVSAAQFIREAALARAYFQIGRRGGSDAELLEELLSAAAGGDA